MGHDERARAHVRMRPPLLSSPPLQASTRVKELQSRAEADAAAATKLRAELAAIQVRAK